MAAKRASDHCCVVRHSRAAAMQLRCSNSPEKRRILHAATSSLDAGDPRGHTLHATSRFRSSRSLRASRRRTASSSITLAPAPKYISSGVCEVLLTRVASTAAGSIMTQTVWRMIRIRCAARFAPGTPSTHHREHHLSPDSLSLELKTLGRPSTSGSSVAAWTSSSSSLAG